MTILKSLPFIQKKCETYFYLKYQLFWIAKNYTKLVLCTGTFFILRTSKKPMILRFLIDQMITVKAIPYSLGIPMH